MPRRTKRFIEPGKVLVDGGRVEVEDFDGEPLYDRVLDTISVDASAIKAAVRRHVQQFDELAQVADLDRLINDLADQCISARTLRLEAVTQGTRTKPDEWTTQILVAGVGWTLQDHGINPAISEYEKRGELTQSLYLRLLPELIKTIGLNVPEDVKGLAHRSKRIRRTRYT